MIVVKVRDRDIKAAPMGPVTTGSVGLPVSWHFDESWDELSKIAVFRVNDTYGPDMAILEDVCIVPNQLLVQDNAGENLWIGVYGRDLNGEIAVPTIWTYIRIEDGAVPQTVDPAEPTPEWPQQVQNAADEALRVAHGVRQDANDGKFDGYSPVVTLSEIPHGHRVNITDKEHQEEGQSFDVMDGASAYEQAVEGGYTGTEAEFNADLARFKGYAQDAQAAQESAETAQTAAEGAASAAEQSETNAAGSASQAAASAAAAEGSASSAEAAKTAAASSAANAEAAKTAAETAQEKAEDAQAAAEAAKTAAQAAVVNAADNGSVDASGLISFRHGTTELFTVQLPLYDGSVTYGS